ncbi:type IV pilus biogenesis protein PilM [Facilibium subflavum]|uniref:type IV pilus biogenesis protein PilM n=1 Tax=Facilibium subflavum TaxID=2219058 RepID=UPI000E65868B|nr:pilus assembly protein PilM [Facilibium subflavum]
MLPIWPFQRKSQTVIAIEWSNAFLRIAILSKKNGGYALELADSQAFEKPCVDDNGQIVDYTAFAQILWHLFKKHRIKHQYAGFLIPATETIIKEIDFDIALDQSQIYDNILSHLERYIAYSVEDTYLDCQVIDQDQTKDKQTVLLVAAHKDHVTRYEKLAKLCRLSPEVLDIDSYALQRFIRLLYKVELAKQHCFVLVGLDTSSYKIHFLDQDRIYYSDQKRLGTQLNDQEYVEIMLPWLLRNLQIFDVNHKNLQFDKIIIYGEKAEIDTLESSIHEFTQKVIEVLDPFTTLLNCAQRPYAIEHPSSYVLTLALATRQVMY